MKRLTRSRPAKVAPKFQQWDRVQPSPIENIAEAAMMIMNMSAPKPSVLMVGAGVYAKLEKRERRRQQRFVRKIRRARRLRRGW